MAKERYQYTKRERTVEDIRRKSSEGSRDYDNLFTGDVKLFKPAEGENIIRILPATWGSQPYSQKDLDAMSEEELRKVEAEDEKYGVGWDLPIFVHYGVGPDNGSYLCRDKMLGDRCPICEAKANARDPEEADALAPTKRGLAWIIDRNAEKEGPQLWSMPFQKIRNEIYSRSVDKKHGTPINPDNVADGFDILFNRTGKDDRTNYTGVEIDRDSSPLHEDQKREDKWLDYIFDHPLPGLLNFFDAEHIEKVLFGRASARRGREEEEEEGASNRSRRGGFARGGRGRSGSSDSEERDYAAGGEEDADAGRGRGAARRGRGAPAEEAEETEEREERGRRTVGRRPAAAAGEEETTREETEEDEEERPRSTARGRRNTDAEPDPEPEEAGTPTDQARSRLSSLRNRRNR